MSSNNLPRRPTGHLQGDVNILKACRPLVNRLLAEGVTLKLTGLEQTNLLKFQKIIQANYNDSEWSYLRVAAGMQVSEIAALTSCLNRFEATQP